MPRLRYGVRPPARNRKPHAGPARGRRSPGSQTPRGAPGGCRDASRGVSGVYFFSSVIEAWYILMSFIVNLFSLTTFASARIDSGTMLSAS